jgi:hypothetical protein
MQFSHVIVWLDHTDAHLIHFNREASDTEVIKAKPAPPNLHIKAGIPGSGHAHENIHYLNDIAAALREALEILIVGPGNEKLVFVRHLIKHHPDLSDKVVALETVDHPSDGQLLAYARKYFIKVDHMR